MDSTRDTGTEAGETVLETQREKNHRTGAGFGGGRGGHSGGRDGNNGGGGGASGGNGNNTNPSPPTKMQRKCRAAVRTTGKEVGQRRGND